MGWTGIDTFNIRNMCARKGNRQSVKKRTNNADTAILRHSTNTPPTALYKHSSQAGHPETVPNNCSAGQVGRLNCLADSSVPLTRTHISRWAW